METFWNDQSHEVSSQQHQLMMKISVLLQEEWRQWADLGGKVLLSGKGLSEGTEAMLDQIIQITWGDQSKVWSWVGLTQNSTSQLPFGHETQTLNFNGTFPQVPQPDKRIDLTVRKLVH